MTLSVIGALVFLLGIAFVLRWRDSAERLRGILREFEHPPNPLPESTQIIRHHGAKHVP